jgi:FG-GAP repeat
VGFGAAWVFTRSGGVWHQQGGKLVGADATGSARQGWSVSLSGNGNTAIVGGPLDNSSFGAAWVYTRTAGVWTQQGSKLVGADDAALILHKDIPSRCRATATPPSWAVLKAI